MRFLIVFKDYLADAQELVAGAGVSDLSVVSVGNGRKVEGARTVAELEKAEPGDRCAIVGVNRKIQRVLERDFGLKIEQSFGTVRGASEALRDWLRPEPVQEPILLAPREALEQAAGRQPERLIFSNRAVDRANLLAPHRHGFVNRAALALEALAAAGCRAPGGLDQFFMERELNFAPNGPILVTVERKPVPLSTEWHLLEGGHTERNAAARLYFCFDAGCLLVLYCGPHPDQNLKVYLPARLPQ